MSETTDAVSVEVDAPLGVITLRAARRRNPLSTTTMKAVTAGLRRFDEDSDVRVIVIRAEGPAFSAGHDLGELVDRTLDDERAVFDTCAELMRTVHEVRQPVIAEVAGMAFAAGCQLVATCDLAVAGRSAKFSTPGVRIGLFCSTPMVALTRAVGRKRAMHMLLTGEAIDAETAADWGLLSGVVDDADLTTTVRELALQIAGSSARTVSIGKQAFYKQIELDEASAYVEMAETMAANAMTCDAQEGMSAFLAKRAPVWTDS
ncbi:MULTISPECIES: enoyl-CoA hydratase-related protein [Gordonia]|jgi:enoyl-CoA hydratase/carnithine racemase|uniref:Enoyl-CoA hydratase domain-containing protein 3, mitochondrial n=2 Tax=Gordonia alkanivorans TaxID=84096 RepID=F9VRM2_9ACTN|nr:MULTISPECIES: enoyl-CoA hydratase-related protein [Gordonia]ETA07314.1 enoyl-CoA hydratase [Gordonia alkanivorans CGMCC 6845]MDH3007784.1 enoyl-CoA hydratase-related protein [Gordonia alkanivorans]MDH3010697.1 enoyl-CoA hydratase-related protein [Gordonia alkanivorans]MDH3015413.1 enoyl-CoA hydratase-related protein [Gordonia alkanivorans]MDH3020147.1 enoyl-CoA hydratase-related protein [Gordonia alkanivorans]